MRCTPHDHRVHPRSRARAFSLIECLISSVVVAMMLVAALNASGASAVRRASTLDSVRGDQLAALLMAEIMSREYEDPDSSYSSWWDSGESSADRQTYDDIDDYDGYTQSPPALADGTPIPDSTGWEWSVNVRWAVSAWPDSEYSPWSETGLKRVTITVSHSGRPRATLVAMRAQPD